jgi:hypothetical protein
MIHQVQGPSQKGMWVLELLRLELVIGKDEKRHGPRKMLHKVLQAIVAAGRHVGSGVVVGSHRETVGQNQVRSREACLHTHLVTVQTQLDFEFCSVDKEESL